ncbi:MAG: c-type cytochrome [Lacipirellulaceae bacterium]
MSAIVSPVISQEQAITTKAIQEKRAAEQKQEQIGFDAEWIWTPSQKKNEAPQGDCYFRKTFTVGALEVAEMQIAADNAYELFVNGEPVGKGTDWRKMEVHDIKPFMGGGNTHTVAVRVSNTDGSAAGLVARVLIKEKAGTYKSFSTDNTWKTSVRRFQGWRLGAFNDADWLNAASFGPLGATLPWGDEVVIAGQGARFTIASEFVVERLMRDEEVGSLIAMTFDSRGNLYASQEGGHLLKLTDADRDGIHDTVTTFCDKLMNTQGIVALGSRVFAVGSGPEGPALYRLRDADRDGTADEVTKLVGFKGSRGEHGAHAVRLGPDGLLYVVIGDHARVDATPVGRSAYHSWYEGDLVRPRYEDPQGHAVGIPAPGGTVLRTDANGSFVELVAGGLRNSYDFAFNAEGELFTYDADMEWDRGAPWYRPTRINHVTAGAEMGWRSGWAKWPKYYLDSLPPAVELGAGSPTGVEFYEHTAFPEKYRGAMFGCDWATGKIYAVTFQRDGASYQGKQEVFLEGRPLNATDIAVGPEGALYFCTGGRGTDGGVYRVRWDAEIATDQDLGTGIERAIRQPQFDADWARGRIAGVKRKLGASWGEQLNAIVANPNRSNRDRIRAVDLLLTFGPRPSDALIVQMADDREPEIRAKAARLMYASDAKLVRRRLEELLEDRDPLVRRLACESLMRRGKLPAAELVLPLLSDDDRFVAFAARRLLEKLPVETWARDVLTARDTGQFLNGSVALLTLERREATAKAVLARCEDLLARGEPSLDLLRVIQLALIHGEIDRKDVPSLTDVIASIYPTREAMIDRELVRLLVHLQSPVAAQKFSAELARDDLPILEKTQIAAYAARLHTGWNRDAKLALLKFYEQARSLEGGYSVSAYVEQFARDFFTQLSLAERQHLLASGEKWPASSLSVLAKLPKEPGAEVLEVIRDLDTRVAPLCKTNDAQRRLRVGIIAVLGQTTDSASHEHLQQIYMTEPNYREAVAMSLTQNPGGENWSFLVDSLKVVEGAPAEEVLDALATVRQRPSEAKHYRYLILAGLRGETSVAKKACELLEFWSGESSIAASASLENQLAGWQAWYAAQFPDAQAAQLPVDEGRDKWSYDELLTFLESGSGKNGDQRLGHEIFNKAQCAACHRVGARGESMGPDLTTVSRRFLTKEILESIVYPSHVISDQYASKLVVVNGKTHVGIVASQGRAGVKMLTQSGKVLEFSHADIDEIEASDQSAMPTGLLNKLTLEEVADLFAYLRAGGETGSTGVARRRATTER